MTIETDHRTGGDSSVNMNVKRSMPGFGQAAVPALFVILFLMAGTRLQAGGIDSFSLDWKTDTAAGLLSLGVFVWGQAAEAPSSGQVDFGWFDEGLSFPYSSNLDTLGDIATLAGLVSLPFLLDRFDVENCSTLAVMYAESALFAFGMKDVLKAAAGRPRPYLSDPDAPEELRSGEDAYTSFPSGHTTLAFMTAAFFTYVFSQGDTSPASKWVMGIGSFSLACIVGILRVSGGVHYASDVLAGAALGTLAGFAVPWLHLSHKDSETLSIVPVPGQFSIMYSFSY